MDREHVKGFAEKTKGAIKEGAGRLSGDKEMTRSIRPNDPPTTPRRGLLFAISALAEHIGGAVADVAIERN